VRREAQDAGACSEAIAAIGLAVSEASTNAVLHAYAADGTRGATFSISTASQGNTFSVWVLDEGHGGISNVPSPGLGLGLGLMAHFCERVLIGALKDGRTQVAMQFDLNGGASS
jgi:anti-sigma regulatory factor (Ser/Thr protein kinase)